MTNTRIAVLGTFFAAVALAACASTPKEIVELSYAMGQDMDALHKSYVALIHDRFEGFRAERLEYFEKQWKQQYINGWVQKGHLVEVANGQLVWSKADKKFVPPAAGKEKDQLLYTVDKWAVTALKDLDGKKKSLLDPLDADEKAMVAQVDEAFSRVDRANAAITAHLNSLRKVQEVQDEALQALKLKDFKTKMDQLVQTTSQHAKDGLEAIKKADEGLDQAAEIAEKVKSEVKKHVP